MGATPVLVDIDTQTFNIDPLALEKAIIKVLQEGTLKPKAIVPVDLFGQPADYDRICKIAEKYNLLVLEDGAQGFGGEFSGKRACSFGHAATTSFSPAKPLGCYGDGGAIFTNDSALDELLRSMRAQGRSPEDKYDNRLIGMNSRLDTLQAAILLPKLKAFASEEVERVNEAAGRYTKLLQDVVITPFVAEGARSSWAQYSILLRNKQQRDGLQAYLKQQGIPSMIYYPRGLHQQSAYAFRNLPDSDFPNTVDTAARILALPMHPYLSQEDITCVAAAVINYLAD
ncbi:MAG: DegT/DnrJ/EryC1/StrS family aminotransferase [Oscillospiraceae bacterium]